MKGGNPEKGRRKGGAGFTLLELLAAIAILSMIVLMMAGVFHQSRIAWGTGMRKSRLCLGGRALSNFIANEMSQAVADNSLPCMINHGANGITFYMFTRPSATERGVQQISYSVGGGGEVRRVVKKVNTGSAYPTLIGAGVSSVLAKDVKTFRFYTSDAQNHTTNLPPWVDVEIVMGADTKESKIAAGSAGPDRTWGSADDIWSDDR